MLRTKEAEVWREGKVHLQGFRLWTNLRIEICNFFPSRDYRTKPHKRWRYKFIELLKLTSSYIIKRGWKFNCRDQEKNFCVGRTEEENFVAERWKHLANVANMRLRLFRSQCCHSFDWLPFFVKNLFLHHFPLAHEIWL